MAFSLKKDVVIVLLWIGIWTVALTTAFLMPPYVHAQVINIISKSAVVA